MSWRRRSVGRPAWGGFSRSDRQLLAVWLCLRLLTGLWIAAVSPLRELTERERAIALWPPSAPLGAWLERVLLAPWQRWDAHYFVKIVEQGYRLDDGTAQFHPLLPWLAALPGRLTGLPMLGLMLVSSVASLLLLPSFERLARLDLQPADARTSTFLFLFSPLAFVLFAPYTEGLFLLLSVLCFLFARRQAWWWAGSMGALATLTRQQGLFLVLPLAWELWETHGRRLRSALSAWHSWAALLLIPAGLGVWLLYRAAVLGDLAANLTSPQALIYSVIVSSSATKVIPVQAFLFPWDTLWLALTQFARNADFQTAVDLFFGACFLTLLVVAWRGMRTSYRIYVVVIALVSFGYYTGPHYAYMGLPRHLFLAFPVFIGLGKVAAARWIRPLVVGAGLFGMLFLLLLYELESWVP